MLNKIKISKIINIVFFLAVFLSCALFIYFRSESKADFSFDDASIYDWSDGWKVSIGTSTGEVMNLPLSIDDNDGKTIILKKKLPNKIKKYNCIKLESNRNDVMVHVAGILRNAYTDKDTRLIGSSSPSATVLVPIYSTDADEDVSILLTSDRGELGELGRIYLGNEMSIILSIIKSNLIWALLILVILVIGIVSLIGYISYRRTFSEGNVLIHLYLFSLFSGIYCLTQSGLRQVFVRDIAIFEDLGYGCLMLIGIAVVLYARGILGKQNDVLLESCNIAFVINYVVQHVMLFADEYDFFEMQTITWILIVVAIMAVVARCISAIHSGMFREVIYLLISVVIFAVGVTLKLLDVRIGDSSELWMILGALAFMGFNGIYMAVSVNREQRLKKDAESANMAKSRFLATMSHEIRTPINAVLGMNEMILRDSKESEIKNYAGRIAEAGKSLLSLVNDILDFSKIESGKMDINCAEYPTKSLLSDLVLMVDARAKKKNIDLVFDIDEELPMRLFGDEVRIKQVITNLLTNAVKYTNEGSITFTVKHEKLENDEINLFVSVKDTGMGIKEEDIGKLMDSFVRVDVVKNKNIEGAGLGLSITKQLLNLMGSSLEIRSEYGVGSDFYFTLKQKIVDGTPMGTIDVGEVDLVSRKGISFLAPDAKVLAVDDNPTNLIVVKGLLKPSKIQIWTCESGAECLEICRDNRFDLILMDHMMPDMDGIETLAKLRSDSTSCNQNTRAIVLTANAVAGAAEIYRERGFDRYITKPIDLVQLDMSLRNILPQELVCELSEDTEPEDNHSENNDEEIPLTTDDIDGTVAMEYSGNDFKSYMEILKSYFKQGVKTLALSGDNDHHLFGNVSIEDFTIKVHSLKSSSKTIGAVRLSDLALKLEDAGREGNQSYIDANEAECRLLYEKVLGDIKTYLEENEILKNSQKTLEKDAIVTSGNETNLEEIRNKLEEVKDALDDFDYDNAMELVEAILSEM